jgi:hypothetical protein
MASSLGGAGSAANKSVKQQTTIRNEDSFPEEEDADVGGDDVDEDRDRFREQLKASEDYFFADSSIGKARTCGTVAEDENEN